MQKRSAWAADCCRDSDSTVSANRPFRFPFFDALYQRVQISADGYLSFADGSLPYPNTDPIPLTLPPNNILAPAWLSFSAMAHPMDRRLATPNTTPFLPERSTVNMSGVPLLYFFRFIDTHDFSEKPHLLH